MIDHFVVDAIFNMGSSGALDPSLQVGDLVIGSEFIQHDFDVTDWGLKPGEMLFDIVLFNNGPMQFRTQQIFRADPALSKLALQVAQQIELTSLNGHTPKTYTGRILSGDQFISKTEKERSLWETHQGLRTDMESAVITFTDFLMGPQPTTARSLRTSSNSCKKRTLLPREIGAHERQAGPGGMTAPFESNEL